MSGEREHVWQGFDANAILYLDDGQGNRINLAGGDYDENTDSPLTDYCYWQDVSIRGSHALSRRPVTGRPNPKLVSEDNFVWEGSVAKMYFSRSEDLQALLKDRTRFFQFELVYEDWQRESPQDRHLLKIAKLASLEITTREAEISMASFSFLAEEFE